MRKHVQVHTCFLLADPKGPMYHHPDYVLDLFQVDDSQLPWLRKYTPGIGAAPRGSFPETPPSEHTIVNALLALPALILDDLGEFEINDKRYRSGTLRDLTAEEWPRVVLLNFERMDRWEFAEANIQAIVNAWRGIREDTSFGVYDLHGVIQSTGSTPRVDHAAKAIDMRMPSCNGYDQLQHVDVGIPMFHPLEYGWAYTMNRIQTTYPDMPVSFWICVWMKNAELVEHSLQSAIHLLKAETYQNT